MFDDLNPEVAFLVSHPKLIYPATNRQTTEYLATYREHIDKVVVSHQGFAEYLARILYQVDRRLKTTSKSNLLNLKGTELATIRSVIRELINNADTTLLMKLYQLSKYYVKIPDLSTLLFLVRSNMVEEVTRLLIKQHSLMLPDHEVYNHVAHVAKEIGLGVEPLIPEDCKDFPLGTSTIEQALSDYFKAHYTAQHLPFFIESTLVEYLKCCDYRPEPKEHLSQDQIKCMNKLFAHLMPSVKGEYYTSNLDNKSRGLNWQNIRAGLIRELQNQQIIVPSSIRSEYPSEIYLTTVNTVSENQLLQQIQLRMRVLIQQGECGALFHDLEFMHQHFPQFYTALNVNQLFQQPHPNYQALCLAAFHANPAQQNETINTIAAFLNTLDENSFSTFIADNPTNKDFWTFLIQHYPEHILPLATKAMPILNKLMDEEVKRYKQYPHLLKQGNLKLLLDWHLVAIQPVNKDQLLDIIFNTRDSLGNSPFIENYDAFIHLLSVMNKHMDIFGAREFIQLLSERRHVFIPEHRHVLHRHIVLSCLWMYPDAQSNQAFSLFLTLLSRYINQVEKNTVLNLFRFSDYPIYTLPQALRMRAGSAALLLAFFIKNIDYFTADTVRSYFVYSDKLLDRFDINNAIDKVWSDVATTNPEILAQFLNLMAQKKTPVDLNFTKAVTKFLVKHRNKLDESCFKSYLEDTSYYLFSEYYPIDFAKLRLQAFFSASHKTHNLNEIFSDESRSLKYCLEKCPKEVSTYCLELLLSHPQRLTAETRSLLSSIMTNYLAQTNDPDLQQGLEKCIEKYNKNVSAALTTQGFYGSASTTERSANTSVSSESPSQGMG